MLITGMPLETCKPVPGDIGVLERVYIQSHRYGPIVTDGGRPSVTLLLPPHSDGTECLHGGDVARRTGHPMTPNAPRAARGASAVQPRGSRVPRPPLRLIAKSWL